MKKIILIFLTVLLLAGATFSQQRELPQVQDHPIETLQFDFSGEWLPSVDPTKIGPKNYRVLTNLRYTPTGGLEGVGGYTKQNTGGITASPEIAAGFHFKKDNPSETHVLVNAAGVVYQNTTAIPAQGNFAATALHTDAAGAGGPRFSNAPFGHAAYTNSKETMIWAGNEMSTSAFITSTAGIVPSVPNPTHPKDFTEAVNNNLTTGQNVAVIGGGIDSYTKLLLHMDGAAGGTTFTDSVGTHSPAATGNAQTDTSQAKFGISSGLFDGVGDYLSIPDHADFDYGAGTLTIDTWVRFSVVTGQDCIYSQSQTTSHVALIQNHDTGKLWLSAMDAGARVILESAAWVPVADTWYHLAVIRGWGGGANAWAITVNGAAIHTFTNAGTMPDVAAAALIGSMSLTADVDFGATGHGATFVGHTTLSPTQKKFGSGAAYFDGTGDTINFADHANWDFVGSLADSQTIELWVRHDDHVGTETYAAQYEGANDYWMLYHAHGSGISFDYVTGGARKILVGDGGAGAIMVGGEITDTDWHHVALVRVGPDLGIYKNGTQVAYGHIDEVDTYARILELGGIAGVGNDFAGYMDDVRYYNGNPYGATPVTGLTDTITIPTAAHVPDANTLLLIHGDVKDFAGWMDEYRISKGVARWTAAFSVPVRPYSTAARTWLIGSPRQLQGIKYYISHANTEASNLTVTEWQGYSWATLTATDGTTAGKIALAQTGAVTWTNTGLAKLKFIENRLLYWYQFSIDAGEADIYRASLDAPWQNLVDIWDGVYRQPIQFQAYKSAKYEDYTLEVNETDPTYYGDLGGMTAAEHLVLMFIDRTTALNWRMVAGKENTTVAAVTISFWDGVGWASVGPVTDTTLDDAGGDKSLGQSGHMSWNPPDKEVEFMKTSFGTTGYAYRLVWSGTLTAGNSQVNTVYGVPAQKTIHPYRFPARFKDRLLLCGHIDGNEPNRCDYSMSHSSQVFNGHESSDGGAQSLYFGGPEALITGSQLYNRMGSNIFIFFLALKENETYVLTGSGPDDFAVFPVSTNIGCPAAKSLVVAEVGFDIANDVQRHVALWISYAGPVIFDGAVIYQIPGLEIYFDPNSDDYMGRTAIQGAFGWFDQTYREYNVIVGEYWFAYNLRLKRWLRKSTDTAKYPVSAWPVRDLYGNEYIYAGLDNGFMMRLEYGTTWDGVGINQRVQTGDFFPTTSIWDMTRLRRVKIAAKRIAESNSLVVVHYADSDAAAVTNWTWENSTKWEWQNSSGWVWDDGNYLLSFDMTGEDYTNRNRVIRTTKPVNILAWNHGLRFEMTTTETQKGFQPMMWGIEYMKERRDH